MDLTLEMESMYTIQCLINVAYGMHPDLKGHYGGMIMLVKGAAASKSSRHIINSRRSKKSEIIGVTNHMPGVLWMLFFLGYQCFKVNKNII